MGKQLTDRERKKIVEHVYYKGKTTTEVAMMLGRSRGSVNYFLKKWIATGSIERSTGLTDTEKKAIVKLVRKKPSITARKIVDKLELRVSFACVTNYLTRRGFACTGTKDPERYE